MGFAPPNRRIKVELAILPRTANDLPLLGEFVRGEIAKDAVYSHLGENEDGIGVVFRAGMWSALSGVDMKSRMFEGQAVVVEDRSFHPKKMAVLERLVVRLPRDVFDGVVLRWKAFGQSDPFCSDPLEEGERLWVVKDGKLFEVKEEMQVVHTLVEVAPGDRPLKIIHNHLDFYDVTCPWCDTVHNLLHIDEVDGRPCFCGASFRVIRGEDGNEWTAVKE